MKILLFLALVGLILGAELNVKDQIESIEDVYPAEKPVVTIPVDVVVCMIGLQADGQHGVNLLTRDIVNALAKTMPTHTPSSLESARPLHAKYEIHYQSVHAHDSFLTEIEQILRGKITSSRAYEQYGRLKGMSPHYEIDGSALDDTLSRAYTSFAKRQDGSNELPYAVFVLNPDKSRILPHGEGEDPFEFNYKYSYENSAIMNDSEKNGKNGNNDFGDGVPAGAQAWIGKGRYVVIDLVARSSDFGHRGVGHGVVHSDRFPILKAADETSIADRSEFMVAMGTTQLCSLVTHAIRYVFLPDLPFDDLPSSDKVYVPLIVLRNHRYWDSNKVGHPFSIHTEGSVDTQIPENNENPIYTYMSQLEKELNGLVMNNQRVQTVRGTHDLGDHAHLSAALYAAMRSTTTHDIDPKTRAYGVRVRHYIDPLVLENQIRNSGDVFTSGLLSTSQVGSESGHTNEHSEILDRRFARDDMEREEHSILKIIQSHKDQGMRVLPVYVFSLVDMPPDLLFTSESLVHAARDMVIVLQPNATSVSAPYFVDRKEINLHPTSTVKHIVAGLAQSLGNVAPPQVHYSQHHKSIHNDYLWSYGHHPFGPFSSDSGSLSDTFKLSSRRNAVLSKLEASYQSVLSAIRILSKFAEVSGPKLTGALAPPSDQNGKLMIHMDEIRRSRELVENSVRQMREMRKAFDACAEKLHAHQFEDANQIATTIRSAVDSFVAYTAREAMHLHEKLECCSLQGVLVDGQDTREKATWFKRLVLAFKEFLFH